MPADYVVYAKCKHGRVVGFCSSNVSAAVMEEFCAEPSYVELIKHWQGDPKLSAGFCQGCEEEARDKQSMLQKLRDLKLLGEVA